MIAWFLQLDLQNQWTITFVSSPRIWISSLLLVTHKYIQINEGREKNANEWWKEVDLLNWQCCSKNTIVEEFANHKEEEKKELDSIYQSTRWKNAILKKLGWSIRWKKLMLSYEKTIPIDKTQDEKKMLLWQSIRWRW